VALLIHNIDPVNGILHQQVHHLMITMTGKERGAQRAASIDMNATLLTG
jgi:hypothetical protein